MLKEKWIVSHEEQAENPKIQTQRNKTILNKKKVDGRLIFVLFQEYNNLFLRLQRNLHTCWVVQ